MNIFPPSLISACWPNSPTARSPLFLPLLPFSFLGQPSSGGTVAPAPAQHRALSPRVSRCLSGPAC